MSRVCQICSHSNRLEIDREIVSGKSKPSIARNYGVSVDSVYYHAENHLSRQLVKSNEIKESMHSGSLLAEIEDLLKRSKSILNKAEQDGKLTIALNAIRETRGTLELMAKICATIYQIQAQELQAQQIENENTETETYHEGLERLSDAELSMLIALSEKMSGQRKDDVIKAVMQEVKFDFCPPAPIRGRRSVPAEFYQDEEWTEAKELQAQDEEKSFAVPEAEPVDDNNLELDSLILKESQKAGSWGRQQDVFERAVVPGSITTTEPQLRRLHDLD